AAPAAPASHFSPLCPASAISRSSTTTYSDPRTSSGMSAAGATSARRRSMLSPTCCSIAIRRQTSPRSTRISCLIRVSPPKSRKQTWWCSPPTTSRPATLSMRFVSATAFPSSSAVSSREASAAKCSPIGHPPAPASPVSKPNWSARRFARASARSIWSPRRSAKGSMGWRSPRSRIPPASPSTSPSLPRSTPASSSTPSRGGCPSALNSWTRSAKTTSFGATGPSIPSTSTFSCNGPISARRNNARSAPQGSLPMLFRSKKPAFTISIARGALESVFDECDRYNVDETGGRLLGTYRHKHGRYELEVTGVLEPGPNAQRSPTYFLQDGDYQEKQFRAIEAIHPEIEHLGNWHTHHVNGLQTLSGGDKTTYFKTVNHD